jgi:iron complex transport system ATP-binding protein
MNEEKQEPALLDLQNISVMRGQKVVLADFSLAIRGDEHVAILGPNGCGKSTLIKTITRECYPVVRDGASMTILGQDRWDVFELRSMLGIVSNDLLSKSSGDASGRDVVLSGFFSSARIFPHHVVDPRHRALADDALTQLQISHLAQRPVCEMSSGEARRVLIARALVHKPRALLFDEPSNSLDVFARHSLRQSMSSLAKAGIGIILVTHDLSDLIPEIERVLLMSNGRIIADGSKDRMLQPDRLESLFRTRVELERHNGYYHMW